MTGIAQLLAAGLLGVDPHYRHGPKQATAGEPLDLEGVSLKWYEVFKAEQSVPAPIRALAREALSDESLAGRLQAKGLGFVILHRCGESFYFLIISTWSGSNELWETVYYKNGDAMLAFAVFPRDGAHKPVYCVWEFGVVAHEMQAWTRFLGSARDEAAARSYMKDRFAGAVE